MKYPLFCLGEKKKFNANLDYLVDHLTAEMHTAQELNFTQ